MVQLTGVYLEGLNAGNARQILQNPVDAFDLYY
jgi:hypothetical protein